MRRVPVLYEDELGRGAKRSQFGLHVLVCACIADRRRAAGDSSASPWAIQEQTDPRPQKGNAALLAGAERIVGEHPRVLIVIDTDRTPAALALPRNAEPTRVKVAIEEHFRSRGLKVPTVCPLDRNTETVVDAVAQVLGEPPPLRKERPLDRDRRLIRLACREDPAARARLLVLVPSFAGLVQELDEILAVCETERLLPSSA